MNSKNIISKVELRDGSAVFGNLLDYGDSYALMDIMGWLGSPPGKRLKIFTHSEMQKVVFDVEVDERKKR
jgi:hypothetical protein